MRGLSGRQPTTSHHLFAALYHELSELAEIRDRRIAKFDDGVLAVRILITAGALALQPSPSSRVDLLGDWTWERVDEVVRAAYAGASASGRSMSVLLRELLGLPAREAPDGEVET